MLSPFEDDKLKRLKFNKFKAYGVRISDGYPKFLILKLADLKSWEIFKIFDAESAVRLVALQRRQIKKIVI